LKYKEEAIALRFQLRIAEEAHNLLEAEFAFQHSEYESEIQSLKSAPRLTTLPKKVNVEIKLQQSESKSADLSKRLPQWDHDSPRECPGKDLKLDTVIRDFFNVKKRDREVNGLELHDEDLAENGNCLKERLVDCKMISSS
jgi:hypothetical protein